MKDRVLVHYSIQDVSTHNKRTREKNWTYRGGRVYTLKGFCDLIAWYKYYSYFISIFTYKSDSCDSITLKFTDGNEVIKLEIYLWKNKKIKEIA